MDLTIFPNMMYASWYKKDVSPNLSKEQKKRLLKKLSDYSLERGGIGSVGAKIPLSEFPELKPFAHTSEFSGLQLYVVMTELFNEVSGHKIKPTYPNSPF
jgi:hypothetical protein